MSALSLGVHVSLMASLGVHNDVLFGDKTILDELAHVLTAVGVGDLGLLVGVEPDLLGAASQDGSSESIKTIHMSIQEKYINEYQYICITSSGA